MTKKVFSLFLFLLSLLFINSPAYAQIATSKDWVGIFTSGAPNPNESVAKIADKPASGLWKYVNCLSSATKAVNTGECDFTVPSAPGTYEFRLYANDTNLLMGSIPFYITLNSSSGSTCNAGYQATGLISTSANVSGTFGNFLRQCITSNQAVYVPFKIPTYDELKTVFYTQIKTDSNKTKHPALSGNKTESDIPFDGTLDHVYLLNNDLTIGGNVAGPHSGVVFVEGNLQFTADYTYGSGTTGTVFVVKGNISIDPGVKTINAVLVSEKIICTSTPATGMGSLSLNCTGLVTPAGSNVLIVNGNLISLDQVAADAPPIRFRRNLTTNNQAAEQIKQDAKYFVILKNLFSQTLQITTELN